MQDNNIILEYVFFHF